MIGFIAIFAKCRCNIALQNLLILMHNIGRNKCFKAVMHTFHYHLVGFKQCQYAYHSKAFSQGVGIVT